MNRKSYPIAVIMGSMFAALVVGAVAAGAPIDGGNDFATATSIAAGVEYTGVVSDADTSDYYSLAVQPGQIITVNYATTKVEPGYGGCVSYYLYDQSQVELSYEYTCDLGAKQVAYLGNNSTPTRYFFVVKQITGKITYDFQIQVADQTDLGAARDAGDAVATATLLTPTVSVPLDAGGNRIGGADLDDYFRVDALPGQLITVTVTPQAWNSPDLGMLTLRMFLYDESFVELDSDYVSEPALTPTQFKWVSNRTAPGVYYIHLGSYSGLLDDVNRSIVYRLQVQVSLQNDANSGGDAGESYATATVITSAMGSVVFQADGFLGSSDRDDFYRINARVGQMITAVVTPVGYDGSYLALGADLDDQDRSSLLTALRSQPSIEPIVLTWMSNSQSPSVYFLHVRDRSNSTSYYSYRYRIQVELNQQSDGGVAGDAGESLDMARSLIPNGAWDRNLLGGSDTADCFLVESEQSYVKLTLTPALWPPDSAGSGLTIRFYDMNKSQIDTPHYIDRPSLAPLVVLLPTSRSGSPAVSGYYVEVASSTSGAYQIQYQIELAAISSIYLPAVLRNYGEKAGCTTAPTLVSPLDNSRLNTLAPLYEWNGGSDPKATQFFLEVAKDAAFTQIANSYRTGGAQGPDNFRFSQNLDPATTYYWRAFLRCGDVQGPYSEVWSFTTGSGGILLPAPALAAPANGSAVPSTTVLLQWSPVSGAVDYLVHYRKVGEGGYIFESASDTQLTISWLSANTAYEWWVTARNEYAYGLDSGIWQFTTPVGPAFQAEERKFILMDDGAGTVFKGQDGK